MSTFGENEEKKGRRGFNTGRVVVALLVLAFVFWVGINVGQLRSERIEALTILKNSSTIPPEDIDFGPFFRTWNILNERFVPATTTVVVTNDDLLWGAVSGLTDAYGDPYTVFLPPQAAELFQEEINGAFGGVGIEIGIRDGVLTVIAPLKDSPADRVGVKAGDRIVEVDGAFTEGFSIDEAVEKIRGEIGTAVLLTIRREGEEELFTKNIVRETIRIPTLDTELRDDGVFVISLYNFAAPSSGLFRDAVREFEASKSDKLILDLRNNPGGFLESAVDVASWFLPSGKVVVTEDFGGGGANREHRTRGNSITSKSFQTVVLVNEGTASASEIVAGALREHGVATVVGKSTFGKGSVQELVPITNTTSLKVTIARWLTPNGNSISDGGLDPDIEVDITEENISEGGDSQLERAVSYLINGN